MCKLYEVILCRFDPVLNQWTSVVAMTCCRSGVGLAVVNNKLCAGYAMYICSQFYKTF